MLNILYTAFKNWLGDDPLTQSAATAYYAIFSLPGLLIIVMALAAIFFDQQRVEEEVLGHISQMLGQDAARRVDQIVSNTQHDSRDFWAMITGIATLLFGATGLFVQLQRSLNRIWEVEVKKSIGWKLFLKRRLISFGMILVIGFLLLISLSLTTVITLLGEWLSAQFSPDFAVILTTINIAFSFLTILILFALIFKILPNAQVEWRVAFLGGALSTVLFTFGQYALNYYFEWAQPQSGFGAAGSVILLMLWVSYSCMILMIGAEFAKICSEEMTGRKTKPDDLSKKNSENPE